MPLKMSLFQGSGSRNLSACFQREKRKSNWSNFIHSGNFKGSGEMLLIFLRFNFRNMDIQSFALVRARLRRAGMNIRFLDISQQRMYGLDI